MKFLGKIKFGYKSKMINRKQELTNLQHHQKCQEKRWEKKL